MELNDWILALHLLSAVALVAALTAFSVMIVALWRTDDPAAVTSFMRLGLVGNVLVTIGSIGTIVFGVWLAISVDRYELWDGWVIAAIILWAIAMALGKQTGLTIVVDSTVGREVMAPELNGRYTAHEALQKILAPTGLRAKYLDQKTVQVVDARGEVGAASDSGSPKASRDGSRPRSGSGGGRLPRRKSLSCRSGAMALIMAAGARTGAPVSDAPYVTAPFATMPAASSAASR